MTNAMRELGDKVPRPFLAVDAATVHANIESAAVFCQRVGLGLRPHFKAHKTAEIASEQVRLGAVGISVATVSEAWDLCEEGLTCALLITSEVVDPIQVGMVQTLRARGADIWLCVESKEGIEELAVLPRAHLFNVLLDVDIGTKRTGALSSNAVELAQAIMRTQGLRFRGIQTYQGHASHIRSAAARREAVLEGWLEAKRVIADLRANGIAVEIVSGGNTSTFEFDVEAGVVTELQLGGYVVGDLDYTALERPQSVRLPGTNEEIPNPARDWQQALRVVATAVSIRPERRVTVNAGLKALATDRPDPPSVLGVPEAHFEFSGDEFGIVVFPQESALPRRGDDVVLLPRHCDPTVNLYGELQAVFDGPPSETWKVIGRHGQSRHVENDADLDTLCVHAGYAPTVSSPSRQVPIYPTVAYALRDGEHARRLLALDEEGYTYSRIHNPTVSVLEKRVAALEGGGNAVATASGAAAVSLTLLTLCRGGDNIVALSTLYGGTSDLMRNTLGPLGIEVRFVPTDGLDELKSAIDNKTRGVFAESLGNPRLDIPDFTAIGAIAHAAGVPLIIDNTAVTPAIAKVRDLGGDVAVYSASKFLGGHGAAIAGVVVDIGTFDWSLSRNPAFVEADPSYRLVFAERFGRAAFATRLRAVALRNVGATLGPFEAWCVLQGIETLGLRMHRISRSAVRIARYLATHPNVTSVRYPGLRDNPSFDRCQKHFGGLGGGLIFFDVEGQNSGAGAVLERVRLISHITQFGDARSSIQHPATTSHQQVPPEAIESCGLSPSTLRLSVGLESVSDIIRDLDQALIG